MIDAPAAISECRARNLVPDAFYDVRHREAYAAMCELYDRTGFVESLALIDKLRRADKLAGIGGITTVASWPDAVPSAANISHYIALVQDKYAMRRLLSACSMLAAKAAEPDADATKVLAAAEIEVLAIGTTRNATGEVSIRQAIQEHVASIESAWTDTGRTLRTGYEELDRLMGGMEPGEVIVVGAAPSVGKTALAGNILAHLCSSGVPCGFFSLEMMAERIAARLACNASGVSLRRVRQDLRNSPELFAAYRKALAQVQQWPLYIVDDSSMSTSQIRGRARRMVSQHGVRFMALDYLQLVRASGRTNNRTEEVSQVSSELKAMARELKVPVLLLAQLSRDHRKNDRMPGLHDLRESGAIEQDADKIILLHPAKTQDDAGKMLVKLLLLKNRNEGKGMVELLFNQPHFRYEAMD